MLSSLNIRRARSSSEARWRSERERSQNETAAANCSRRDETRGASKRHLFARLRAPVLRKDSAPAQSHSRTDRVHSLAVSAFRAPRQVRCLLPKNSLIIFNASHCELPSTLLRCSRDTAYHSRSEPANLTQVVCDCTCMCVVSSRKCRLVACGSVVSSCRIAKSICEGSRGVCCCRQSALRSVDSSWRRARGACSSRFLWREVH